MSNTSFCESSMDANSYNFTIAHLNVRSINSCFLKFSDFVFDNNFDIIAVTETWISETSPEHLFNIKGYKLISVHRTNRRGGGVAFYVRDSIRFKVLDTSFINNNSLEHLWILCTINNKSLCLGVIYNSHCSLYKDLDILDALLAQFSSQSDYLMCTGDINVNLFENDYRTTYVNDILNANGLHQLINECTRPSSNSLIDVMLVSDHDIILDSGTIDCSYLSDHKCVYSSLNFPKTLFTKETFVYRDFSHFQIDDFYEDCDLVDWNYMLQLSDINDKIDFLNNNILFLFDMHAPLKTIINKRNHSPWITPVVKIMQRKRDKALINFKKYRTPEKYEYYKQLRNLTTAAIRREKRVFIEHDINENINNSSKLWRNLNRVGIKKENNVAIPDSLCKPQEYGHHLINNISSIPINPDILSHYLDSAFNEQNIDFFSFTSVDSGEVEKVIEKFKSNAVGKDGISRKMVLIILPKIIDYITHIINTCLIEGSFPEIWKSAIVRPICKHGDPSSFDDLRPISILPTLSKVLERICYNQIMNYVIETNILPDTQSGFRSGYSTNTCLLNIVDYLTGNYDNSKTSVLIQIDFSKAFDMVDHTLLTAKLHYYKFSDLAVEWCRNYLANRCFQINMGVGVSSKFSITRGVPQGSILGPLFFLIYVADLSNVFNFCTMHSYADDTLILASFDSSELNESIVIINKELDNAVDWVNNNGLRINPTKSTLMLMGTRVTPDIVLNDVQLQRKPVVKILGLLVDEDLNFRAHLNTKLTAARIKLRGLFQYRHLLSSAIKLRLVKSLVLPIFDYCACVYIPFLTELDKRRVTMLLNSCLRFVYGICKYDHISTYRSLAQIDDINIRVQKIYLCLIQKIKLSGIPSYLRQKLITRHYHHNVRIKNLYVVPSYKKSKFKSSFSYLAPTWYNRIPHEMRLASLGTFNYYVKQKFLPSIN